MNTSPLEKLKKIIEFNSLITQTDDYNELLHIILKETEKIFDVEGSSILLEDNNTGNLFFHITNDLEDKNDLIKSIKMKHGEGVCGHVFVTKKSLIVNNPQNNSFFSNKVDKKTDFITKNLIAIPLQFEDKIFGVIELVNKRTRDFSEDDLEFLKAIAHQISFTLERVRLVEERIKSERLATIGETVAGLSHFIKNILHGLKGGEYIVNKNIDETNSPKLIKGWKMVEKYIHKISDLTLEMLEYSKTRVPEYKLININSIIFDIEELLKNKLDSKKIILKTNLQNDIGLCEIDPRGIFRCLLNLITNSIDALDKITDGKIEISTEKENKKNIKIIIKDNGCGISIEHFKKIFTKYFSTKGSKGTGLGLLLTKKIIDEHNGSISCISKLNKGTSFVIRLPKNIPDYKKKGEVNMEKNILIVDDEKDSLDFITSVLEDENYHLITALNGDECVKKISENSVDLIILDLQMPGKDGFETFIELKKLDNTKNIPIIMLTGIAEKTKLSFSKDEMGKFYGKEPEYYFEKPVEPQKLLEVIKKLI